MVRNLHVLIFTVNKVCLFCAGIDLDKVLEASFNYSRTSMARTPMARLPWLIQTRFRVPMKFFR